MALITRDQLAPLFSTKRWRAMVRTEWDNSYRFLTIRVDAKGFGYVITGRHSKAREYLTASADWYGTKVFTARYHLEPEDKAKTAGVSQ